LSGFKLSGCLGSKCFDRGSLKFALQVAIAFASVSTFNSADGRPCFLHFCSRHSWHQSAIIYAVICNSTG
jgi:hypothetical protein